MSREYPVFQVAEVKQTATVVESGPVPPAPKGNTKAMNNAQRIWNALGDNGVDKVAYLPCNKLNAVMQVVPDDIEVWDITKESIGLALCFGRSLAGKRSAMFIQNTGLGNLITELYTMQKLYQEPLPIFVSWRGYYKEPIEAQVIFGGKVEALLKSIDVEYRVCKSTKDIEDLPKDVGKVYAENKVKVYLLSPELWEQNSPDYHVFGAPQLSAVDVKTESYAGTPTLTRKGAIDVVMQEVGDNDIIVSQIGFPAKETYNSRDRDQNFYMLGALGAATEVGIGLAHEVPKKHVYVIDGDGSFFFNPNQLVDLATLGPKNLSVICLDNGSWGSTGNQPTLSSKGMNLSAYVRTFGVTSTGMTDSPEGLKRFMKDKLSFIHYMIKAGNDKVGGEIPLSAMEIKERFKKAIGA